MEFQFKVIKHVTLPTLKQETGVPLFLRIEDKIYKAKELTATRQRKSADGSVTPMAPPELVTVFNHADQHTYTLIANSVLAENLRDMYPEDGYVGKTFRIVRNQMAGSAGRKYATYDITEGSVSATEAPAAQPAAPAPTPAAAPTPISAGKPAEQTAKKPEPAKALGSKR